MFIQCRNRVRIKDFAEGRVCDIPVGYIGDIPEWVEHNPYFKKLCEDGTITTNVSSIKDSALESSDDEAAVKKKVQEDAAAKQRKIDEAAEAARKEAEKEAADSGLDEGTKRNLVKKKMEKAMKEAGK